MKKWLIKTREKIKMLLQMIHDVNPHVINHRFQFGFTKRFKAVSSKYCCNLCNRSFFCFHNLCRWICKLVNLHMYFFFAWSSFQVRSNIWCFFAWSSFQARSNIWCRSFEKNSFQIISPIGGQMGDEVRKPTDVQFYIHIYL